MIFWTQVKEYINIFDHGTIKSDDYEQKFTSHRLFYFQVFCSIVYFSSKGIAHML